MHVIRRPLNAVRLLVHISDWIHASYYGKPTLALYLEGPASTKLKCWPGGKTCAVKEHSLHVFLFRHALWRCVVSVYSQ